MKLPSETALRGRAKTLIEAMTERTRWVYAVPRGAGEGVENASAPTCAASVEAILEAEGLRCEERDSSSGVVRYSTENRAISFVLFDNADLEVLLVEAEGGDAPKVLAKVLEKTGFYAQSTLLKTALDVRDEEAPKALRTLAHMVVAWDEDWSDLFLLHLASPDPVVRHEATLALSIAAMVAREAGPAAELLNEAIRREAYPKLKDTMREALNLVQGMMGGPVEIMPQAEPGGTA